MKIKKQQKKNKLVIPIIIIVILLFIGVVGVVLYLTHKNASKPQEPVTTKVSHISDKEQSQALKDNPDKKQTAVNTDQPPTPSPSSTPSTNKQQVQMVASYSISDNTLYIRGGINYPVNEGNCYAMLTGPSGQSIRKDTTLLQNPASTDCKTISVPLTDLAPGKWTFTLNYTSDSYEGVSSENSFSI